jgi:hypothetical protein
MVKGRVPPGRGVVTTLASLRYSRLNVVGIGRALKVRQVTGHAAGVRQVVISVDVTLSASSGHVRPG